MISKVLAVFGIILWIIGTALMDSDPMIIPALMSIVGVSMILVAYRISKRKAA